MQVILTGDLKKVNKLPVSLWNCNYNTRFQKLKGLISHECIWVFQMMVNVLVLQFDYEYRIKSHQIVFIARYTFD